MKNRFNKYEPLTQEDLNEYNRWAFKKNAERASASTALGLLALVVFLIGSGLTLAFNSSEVFQYTLIVSGILAVLNFFSR
jgi:hypothetical protein